MKIFTAILIGLIVILAAAVIEAMTPYFTAGSTVLAISGGIIYYIKPEAWQVAAAYFVIGAIVVHFGALKLAKISLDFLWNVGVEKILPESLRDRKLHEMPIPKKVKIYIHKQLNSLFSATNSLLNGLTFCLFSQKAISFNFHYLVG